MRLYVRRSMIFLFLIVFFYRSKTNKNANPREKGYWLLSAPKYECNTSKRKKNIFSMTFYMWEDKTKKQKSCLWLGHVCFCDKTFRDFFFMENSALKKKWFFYILKQVLYWKFSETRLLLVSKAFDHEGQKMFVCVDGLRLL